MKRTTKKETSKKKLTIFDWLKEITYNKSPWNSFTEEDKKSFDAYMIHRYISMNSDYIEFVNLVQRFPYNDKEKIYNTYVRIIPKKNIFLKYIKSNTNKKQDALIKYVAIYYECSLREAEEYIDVLENDVSFILKKLGLDDKEIKKLLK